MADPFNLQFNPQMLDFGLNNLKGANPMTQIMYAIGMPVYSRANGGSRSIYEDMYMAAIRQGQDPYASLPWLNGSRKDAEKAPDTSPVEKNGLPKYYADWFRERGKYGGVPPVPGLL